MAPLGSRRGSGRERCRLGSTRNAEAKLGRWPASPGTDQVARVDGHRAAREVERGDHEAIPAAAHLALAREVRLAVGLDYDEQVPDRAVEGPVVETVTQPVARGRALRPRPRPRALPRSGRR